MPDTPSPPPPAPEIGVLNSETGEIVFFDDVPPVVVKRVPEPV